MLCLLACLAFSPLSSLAQTINLPTGKQLLPGIPGNPQRLNSLPMATAISPDGRYLAIVNAGFGTAESNYAQSIAVVDLASGRATDYPEARTENGRPQTLYSGLAFSSDGTHLYASLDSLSDPEARAPGATGNAIAVYSMHDGVPAPERVIAVPLQRLAAGRTQNQLGKPIEKGMAIPLPTGLAVLKAGDGSEQILVADEFSDDVLLLDAATGRVVARFDLASSPTVPASYPISVVASHDGRHAFVALWNGSAVAELDLRAHTVIGRIALEAPLHATKPSSHPVALLLSADGKKLYAALANRDSVVAIDVEGGRMRRLSTYDTRLPGQQYFGAMPDAMALSEDGRSLYVANSGSDAVAVFHLSSRTADHRPLRAAGFVPTEWYPTALAVHAGKLYVATAKGTGTGPNQQPQRPPADPAKVVSGKIARPNTYIATLLYGSLAAIDLRSAEGELGRLSEAVLASNQMHAARQHLIFKPVGGAGQTSAQSDHPIRHVVYIIKENRTYDQIFGDLGVGDGDKSLTMYGEEVTPNLHKLARQFGVLDNFYDSGEVSGDGHVWSTAGITSDYTERNWQQAYRGKERMYDYEGVVEEGYPLEEGIPDINEPESGYLWTDLARHGKSLYHFGEYVSTKFCDDSGEAPKDPSPLNGTPEPVGGRCPRNAIGPGEKIPPNYGGGLSPYPWKIPLIYRNVATKPELRGHFDPDFPDFNLSFPDQLRVEEFLTHLHQWERDRGTGKDSMPSFIMLRLPNDHTAGTRPGSPTPKASVADNDLAVGRAVEAISQSPFWEDTAFFILEDDAQNGADHVDAHRSISLEVSKYAPRAASPVVDHTFYTTVSVLRTIEDLLGVPPMNNNDAYAPLMQPLLSGAGDQPAFAADYRNRENKLIYQANTARSPGAKESARMDFSREDRADAVKLNAILWRDAKGVSSLPTALVRQRGRPRDER